MSQIMTIPSGCLGNIQYDSHKASYVSDKNRPAFLEHVNMALPPNNKLNRCHSYSFFAMEQCLISILNRLPIYRAVPQIFRFINIFERLGDYTSQYLMHNAKNDFHTAYLQYLCFPSQERFDIFLQNLNILLSVLNSMTGNLRYPSNQNPNYGNSWNHSIGSRYDLREWFYVQDGRVYYDETGPLFGIDVRQYMNNHADLLSMPLPENGFCIHSYQDRYLIRSLAEFNNSLGNPTCAQVVFLSAFDSHAPFLFSSSNIFCLPRSYNECSCVIQIPMLQLSIYPTWIWQVLDCK